MNSPLEEALSKVHPTTVPSSTRNFCTLVSNYAQALEPTSQNMGGPALSLHEVHADLNLVNPNGDYDLKKLFMVTFGLLDWRIVSKNEALAINRIIKNHLKLYNSTGHFSGRAGNTAIHNYFANTHGAL